MSKPRVCCLDLDTFFVSVERLLDPSLNGKPVVVGASPGQRGVVSACSYEVRARGVRSGMSIRDAVRLAPDAIYLPTRHGVYTPYAGRVREVLLRHTPSVVTASIDEFYLDFTGCERVHHVDGDVDGDATIERAVRRMCERIRAEVGLPASAGIGASRAIAKIASGVAKPAGVRMVRAGEERGFLAPLPVRKLPGIGPVMEQQLISRNVTTLGDLVALTGPMRARFGGLADQVAREMTGQGGGAGSRDRPSFIEHDPDGAAGGSISNERTFAHDVGDGAAVEQQLLALVERVCWRARSRGIRARTVTLKLRWADFTTITRARTIPATHRDAEVWRCIDELQRAARALRPQARIRLVGVQLSHLVVDQQLDLPLDAKARVQVGTALDVVRDRYGFDAVRLGAADGPSRWIEGEPRPRASQRPPPSDRDDD